MESEIKFMKEALAEAETAFAKGEVPVGAVLVIDDKIVARAHNLVETLSDATAHAELLCLKKGAELLGNWRLLNATLYCTLEPCPMCAGAMIHSRLERLVWGAPDLRCGAHGSWINLFDVKHPIHQVKISTGLMKEDCAQKMKSFFKNRRLEKSEAGTLQVAADPCLSSKSSDLYSSSLDPEKDLQTRSALFGPPSIDSLFDELAEYQRKKLLKFAQRIIPDATADDVLQPNDFPELEQHPLFRYEEGVLEGLLTARMAYLARQREE